MIRPGSVAIVALCLVVIGCGSSDGTPPAVQSTEVAPTSPEPTSGSQTTPRPITRSAEPVDPADGWAALTSTIERDGTVPMETALQAFAWLIGPIPGVEPPTGAPPDVASGSAPIRWVIGHWDELTAVQRDAVTAALEPPETTASTGRLLARTAALGPGVGPITASTCPPGKDSLQQAAIESQAASASATIAERLGRSLRLPVVVRFVGPKSGLAAEAVPRDAACKPTAARPAMCVIEVTDRGEGLGGFEIVDVIAHEVFHCFQYDLAKTAAEAGKVASWLAEGSAAWVGEDVSSGSTVGEQWWEDWVKYPERSLFSRSYDGVGFFAHMSESGTNPWPLFDRMLKQGAVGSVAAYNVAAKAGGDKVLDTWGAGYVRHQTLFPDWGMRGPGLPEYIPTPLTGGPLENNETLVGGASPLGADANIIELHADSMVIEEIVDSPGVVHGLVRLPDGRQMSLEEAVGKPFCAKPGGCACPTGSAGDAHAWQSTSPGEMLLGFTGHTDGVDVWIQGYSVETACAQAPEDFKPEEPCWCPPGPLGMVPAERITAVRRADERPRG